MAFNNPPEWYAGTIADVDTFRSKPHLIKWDAQGLSLRGMTCGRMRKQIAWREEGSAPKEEVYKWLANDDVCNVSTSRLVMLFGRVKR